METKLLKIINLDTTEPILKIILPREHYPYEKYHFMAVLQFLLGYC